MKTKLIPLLTLISIIVLTISPIYTQRPFTQNLVDTLPDPGSSITSIETSYQESVHSIYYTYNQMVKNCDFSKSRPTIGCVVIAGQAGVSGSSDGVNGLLNNPMGITKYGSLVVDSGNHKIRMISSSGSTGYKKSLSTFAGIGEKGFRDGYTYWAKFNNPTALDFTYDDKYLVADSGNNRIRKIENGQVTTIAGNGEFGFGGDNGPAIKASFSGPTAVAESNGEIFIIDSQAFRIRKIGTNGNITTIAGTGIKGSSGEAGLAINAKIDPLPNSLFVNSDNGEIFFADMTNSSIRVILPNQKIYTVATVPNLKTFNLISSLEMHALTTDGKIYYISSYRCPSPWDTLIDGDCVTVCNGKSLCGGLNRGKCGGNRCICAPGFYGDECENGAFSNGYSVILLVVMSLILFMMF